MRIGILGSGLMGGKLGTDAVLPAVHWNRFDDVLHQAGDLSGKVLVTCSLPMNDDDTALVVAHTSSGAEELAKKVRRGRRWRTGSTPTTTETRRNETRLERGTRRLVQRTRLCHGAIRWPISLTDGCGRLVHDDRSTE